jgi:transposase-like protein
MSSTAAPIQPANILDEMIAYQPLVKPWKKRFTHLELKIQIWDMAPPTERCPRCGKPARRHYTVRRGPLLEPCLDGQMMILVNQGVYHCLTRRCRTCRTGHYFRKDVPSVRPRGRYTKRARQLSIDAVQKDNLPFSKTAARMQRDFGLAPDRSTTWRWYQERAETIGLEEEDFHWPVVSLSGIVCMDEMYDGDFCILVATDPLSNYTLGFQVLTGSPDSQQIADFMRYLQSCGVDPQVVVRDDSALYPKALQEVWPEALEQLCVFHVLKNMIDEVKKSLREYTKSVPKPPKHGRGRPRKDEPRRESPDREVKELNRSKGLVLVNPEKLEKRPELADKLAELLKEHPALQLQRSFMTEIFAMFDRNVEREEALDRRCALLGNVEYQADSHLQEALKKINDEKQFLKMITFTGFANLNRTNNHVERENRRIRKMLTSHYSFRKEDTLTRALTLLTRLEREGRAMIVADKLRPRARKEQPTQTSD